MEGIEGARNAQQGWIPTPISPPPTVGDEEILTGETGTAGGKLQYGETVQTPSGTRGRTVRMQRGEETWTGTGGMELFLGGKDEDGDGERN